jgi:hypothetical protein
LPSLKLEQPQLMRLRLVSGFCGDSIQQIHSFLASGVMSFQVSNAFGWSRRASSRFIGRSWTTPPGMLVSSLIKG